jgi:transmembrane sensor
MCPNGDRGVYIVTAPLRAPSIDCNRDQRLKHADDIDNPRPKGPDAPGEEAAAWVVRVQAEDATREDWLALETWLRASPDHLAAFDEAERLYLEFDRRSADILALQTARTNDSTPNLGARRLRSAQANRPVLPRWAPAAAVAAGLAAVALAAWLNQPIAPPAQVYSTEIGQRREVTLADGSSVALNSGSRLIARVDRAHRQLTLDRGEAIFDVAHDKAHPFVVSVGDRVVTDVGTQFDILRYNHEISVTVSRGMVQVVSSGPAAAVAVRLGPGDQFRHREGSRASEVARVGAEQVLAWRAGYVIYDNRTLADIAADLDRYFRVPIQVDPSASRLTFSGALKIDNEETVVHSLQKFMPITAVQVGDRIVLLKAR